MTILVVIPAYNEEENIEQIVDLLRAEYGQYDYIVVNDGSFDKTAEICRMKKYRMIDLPVNLGLANAFKAGLQYACEKGYDCVVQLDGDGQHRPEYIEAMKKELEQGADIVIGSRFLTKSRGCSPRMIGSRILSATIRLTTGIKISDPTSGMRMFSKRMIQKFAKEINYGPEPDTISYLIKRGFKVKEISVIMDERQGGTSYLGLANSIHYMIRMIISILLIQNFRK